MRPTKQLEYPRYFLKKMRFKQSKHLRIGTFSSVLYFLCSCSVPSDLRLLLRNSVATEPSIARCSQQQPRLFRLFRPLISPTRVPKRNPEPPWPLPPFSAPEHIKEVIEARKLIDSRAEIIGFGFEQLVLCQRIISSFWHHLKSEYEYLKHTCTCMTTSTRVESRFPLLAQASTTVVPVASRLAAG